MFKNMIIAVLAVTLLIVICNTSFNWGPMSFQMPSRSTDTKIEQRLMSAARLIEDAKTDKVLRQKVEKVLANWE